MKKVSVSNVTFGGDKVPLIAGPCVVETYKLATDVAKQLVTIGKNTDTPIVYKSSFDKANRSSNSSYRLSIFDQVLNLKSLIYSAP